MRFRTHGKERGQRNARNRSRVNFRVAFTIGAIGTGLAIPIFLLRVRAPKPQLTHGPARGA